MNHFCDAFISIPPHDMHDLIIKDLRDFNNFVIISSMMKGEILFMNINNMKHIYVSL